MKTPTRAKLIGKMQQYKKAKRVDCANENIKKRRLKCSFSLANIYLLVRLIL